VAAEQIEAEVERFREAVDAAVEEVASLRRTTEMPDELAQLVDAHVQILKDPKIREEVEKRIRVEHLPAEHCVRTIFLRQAERLEALDDETVVVDTKSSYVYIGRLAHAGEMFWVLEDVDVHDCSEGSATKEKYILEAAQYGAVVNRRQVKRSCFT